ncbi:MAG: hypothetical protein WC003_13045 [Terrimicrobiaceae bacterium]
MSNPNPAMRETTAAGHFPDLSSEYFADGMRVMRPVNPSQENDRVKFLGGKQPGELADSPLNTLVYGKR